MASDSRIEEMATRLHSASIRLLRLLRREDDSSGLSGPRLSALSVIVFAGPVSLAELAVAEQVRPPTMSRIVDALVEAGRERRVRALTARLATLADSERRAVARAVEILERVLR